MDDFLGEGEMGMQEILVYVIIALAVAGAVRYSYRKINALKKNKDDHACDACPLKDSCEKMKGKKKAESLSCCF